MFSLALLAQGCPFLPTDTELRVVEVVVVAEPANFQLGETSHARATLTDAVGNELTDIEVSWSSSRPSVATVTPNGGTTTAIVTGVGAGIATITASAEGKNGSAAVQVTSAESPPAPVHEVQVALASSSLDAGGTTQATAALRDADGNELIRAVTWSSSDQNVATVSSNGGTTAVVTAKAAGAAQIRATAEGKTGSQTLTVAETGGGGSGALVNECASPKSGWLWCDDFEQDRLSNYFEYDNAGGNFVRQSGTGVEGSQGMRARFDLGQVSAGSLKLAVGKTPQSYFRSVDAGTANYRELYWRVFVRNEPTWTGGGGDKLSRATSITSSSWAQSMIAHVWSGSSSPNVLVIDPASGTDELGNVITTTYNDFANLRWLGAVHGTIPLFDSNHVGQWRCVEAHARLNDAGQSNALFEMWIDGQLDARKSGFNWVGAFNTYGINAVFLENYWNDGSPKAQERYFDNFVVSTQRIGCGGDSPGGSPSVGSVSLDIAQSSLGVGGTTQATASVRDESGNVLTGRAVIWSSDDPAVASVLPTGAATALVTGLRPGSATLTAAVEGKSANAGVTVSDGASSGEYPNEPAGFNLVTVRPFNLEAEAAWDALSQVPGGLLTVPDASAPKSAPFVGQVIFPAGWDGGSAPGKTWKLIGSHGYTKLYVSFWVKISSNWYGHPSKVNKLGFVYTHDKPVVCFANVGTGSGPLFSQVRIQDTPGGTGGAVNYEANLSNIEIRRGQWVRWEVLLVNNTGDNSNGQIHWWINGTKAGQYSDVLFGDAGDSKEWQQLMLYPIWGGGGSSVPNTMYMWMDHWYTSGAR